MVMDTCNPSTQEVRTKSQELRASLGYLRPYQGQKSREGRLDERGREKRKEREERGEINNAISIYKALNT